MAKNGLVRSRLPKGRVSASATFFQPVSGTTLQRVDYDPRNHDLLYDHLHQGQHEKLSRLSREDHSVSFSVWVSTRASHRNWYIQLMSPDGVTLKRDDKLIQELQTLLLRNDPKSNKSQSEFSFKTSFKGLLDQLLRMVKVRGAAMVEAVLDEKRQPSHIKALDTAHIDWNEPTPENYKPVQRFKETGSGIKFQQIITKGNQLLNGKPLNYPNIFYSRLDGDPDHPFPDSPILPVLHSASFRMIFLQDLQEVVKKTAWPRISLKVMTELLMKSMPPQYMGNPKLMQEWRDAQMAAYSDQFRKLTPGQAIVHEDYLVPSIVESKAGTGKTLDASPLINVLEKTLAQSTKTYDTILGQSGNIDPLQVFIEAQSLKGYQQPVEDVISEALTFFLRVKGVNAIAKFQFGPFDMRPESELEPMKAQRIKNVLTKLALGAIDEDEANIEIAGRPRTDASILGELKGDRDFLDKLLGIQEDAPEQSDTDTTVSPGKGPNNPDKRSDPDATIKRGKTPSKKRTGEVKTNPNDKSRASG